jgi:hypothetical protein
MRLAAAAWAEALPPMRFGDFETKIRFVTQVAAIHGAFPAPLRAHTARLALGFFSDVGPVDSPP